MKRKILSFILTLCMIMSALPLTVIDASAIITDSGSCGRNITYSIYDNGDLVLRGSGATDNYTSSTGNSGKRSPLYGNIDFKNVKIEEGITALGDLLFENCTNITSVYFPASLEKISGNAFSGCSAFTDIRISENNRFLSFNNGVFTCENGTNIVSFLPMPQSSVYTVPEGIKTISSSAFAGNTAIKEINLPSTLETIGSNAFSGCTALEKMNFAAPSSLKNIGEDAIEDTLFYKNCPGGVVYLGDILYRCKPEAGGVVNVKEGTKFLQNGAFLNSNVTSVNLPASLISAKKEDFDFLGTLQEINVDPGNKNISSVDGVFYNGDKTELIFVPKNYKNTVLNLPEGLITIKASAAAGNYNIETINFSDSVKYIEDHAFYRLAASYYEVNISENSALETIGDYAFAGKEGRNQYEPGSYIYSIVIPSGVKSVGYGAFNRTSIYSLYIYSFSCAYKTPWDYYDALVKAIFVPGQRIAGYEGSTAEKHVNDINSKFPDNSIYSKMKYVFVPMCRPETLVYQEEKAPTCAEYGCSAHYKCSYCGKLYKDNVNMNEVISNELKTEKLPHTAEYVPEKASTCSEYGYKSHYRCSVCGALLADAEGKTEITAEAVKIPKTEHTPEAIPAKKPTCIEKGNNLYYRCSVCNNYYKRLSDSVKNAFALSAWCYAGAYTEDLYAFISEGELNSGFTGGIELNLKKEGDTVTAEIYVKGHKNYGFGNAVINYPASVLEVISAQSDNNRINTDTSVPGKVEFSEEYNNSSIPSDLYLAGTVKFRVTGDVIETTPEAEILDFTRHTKGEEFIKENEVLPTCTSTGHYTKAYLCTVCGAIAAREAVETDIVPHTAEFIPEKAPTCAEEGFKEHYKCTVCGKLFSDKDCTAEITAEDIKISVTEHILETIPAKLPTCTEKGNNLYYRCTVCKNCYIKASDKASNAFTSDYGVQISDNELNPGLKSGYEITLKLTGDIITADFYIKNKKGHKFYDVTLNYNENAVEFTGSEYTFSGIRCDNSETGRVKLKYGYGGDERLPIETDLLHFATLKFRITGNLIETTPGNEEYFYKDYKGDIDFDGEITALDARHLLRASVALENIPEEHMPLADVDGDEMISASDASYVLRAAVGIYRHPAPETSVHTPGKAVKENEKAASCKTSGYYDEVTYCEKCNKELSRERVYIPATGENHQLEKIPAKSPTCSNPGNNEYFYCRTCDKYFKLTENITPEDFTVISSCYFNDGSVISDNRVSADSADSSFIKGTELVTSGNKLTVNLKNCRGLIADELTIYFNPDIISKSRIEFGTDLKEIMEWGSQNRYSSEKNYKNIPGTIKIAGYFMYSLGEIWNDEGITVNTDFFNTNTISFTVLPHYVETTPEKELIRETGDHVKAEKTENEIPSTCIKEGSREIVTYCTVCGEELGRVNEILPLADHTPGEKVYENKVYPTATADGSYDIVCYCSVCGKELSREKYLLPGFKVHEFGEWTVITQASCTSTGLKTRKCLNCNAEETEIIPMLPHVKGKGVMENKVAPTFTEDGSYDVVFYCTVCGKEIERVTFPVPAKNHFWTGWEVTEAPTCTEAGIKTRKCIECGQVETAFIEKCPHTEKISPALPPTCVSVGYTEGVKCAVCGEILSAPKEIPMIPHADADNDGYCDMCGRELSEEKPDCKCICHSENKFIRFFYKIACFFWKLFKINQFCECGAQHW